MNQNNNLSMPMNGCGGGNMNGFNGNRNMGNSGMGFGTSMNGFNGGMGFGTNMNGFNNNNMNNNGMSGGFNNNSSNMSGMSGGFNGNMNNNNMGFGMPMNNGMGGGFNNNNMSNNMGFGMPMNNGMGSGFSGNGMGNNGMGFGMPMNSGMGCGFSGNGMGNSGMGLGMPMNGFNNNMNNNGMGNYGMGFGMPMNNGMSGGGFNNNGAIEAFEKLWEMGKKYRLGLKHALSMYKIPPRYVDMAYDGQQGEMPANPEQRKQMWIGMLSRLNVDPAAVLKKMEEERDVQPKNEIVNPSPPFEPVSYGQVMHMCNGQFREIKINGHFTLSQIIDEIENPKQINNNTMQC